MTFRFPRLALSLLAAVLATALTAAETAPKQTAAANPLRALLITGGCCHDYVLQANALTEATKSLGEVNWTVINEGGKGTRGQLPLYDNPDWAKPYDVVVHNECFADTDDLAYIQKITAAHKAGKPAVVIHCAMHSYRAIKDDTWREFLGVTSRRHDHQSRYAVRVVAKEHPALRGFPGDWITPMDELYIIDKLWPKAKALAVSTSERDTKEHPVIWVNDYHGTRVFGTTYGHSNATWHDPVFLALVVRGMSWAAGRD